MRRNQDWDLLLSRHRTSGNAVWVCLLLKVPRLGTRCGVSESEGVIIKALVSLSRTLLPPLRSLWLAHSSGQEEVGRGTRGNRCQHCLCMRRGLTLLRATISFIYGAACQQAECASAAGPHLALCGSHGVSRLTSKHSCVSEYMNFAFLGPREYLACPLFPVGEGNGKPPYSCLGNPTNRGA